MYYKVIEYFGPEHPAWKKFASNHWIKPLTAFDSIDGILCPDLFAPKTDEDWAHRVARDSSANMISSLEYALGVHHAHPEGRLVGVEEDTDCDERTGLLGYDIIDYYDSVSLVTNWDPLNQSHPLKEMAVKPNGLIEAYQEASRAASRLRAQFAADDHAAGATVWAVFEPPHNKSLKPTTRPLAASLRSADSHRSAA